MIYAIECVGSEYVKFGFTAELTAHGRMRDLQIGCPFPLRVIATCAGGQSEENRIHTMLVKAHHRGEWFKRGKEVDAILSMMRRDAWRQNHVITDQSKHPRFGKVLDYAKSVMSEKRSLEPKQIEAAPSASASSRSVRDGKCVDPTIGFNLAEWRASRAAPAITDTRSSAAMPNNVVSFGAGE